MHWLSRWRARQLARFGGDDEDRRAELSESVFVALSIAAILAALALLAVAR